MSNSIGVILSLWSIAVIIIIILVAQRRSCLLLLHHDDPDRMYQKISTIYITITTPPSYHHYFIVVLCLSMNESNHRRMMVEWSTQRSPSIHPNSLSVCPCKSFALLIPIPIFKLNLAGGVNQKRPSTTTKRLHNSFTKMTRVLPNASNNSTTNNSA